MEEIIRNWKRYLFALWLGGSIPAAFNVGILDFRFWAVALPTVLFVKLINERVPEEEEW
jgi:hypothetical protein